jgi:hypothetical protein
MARRSKYGEKREAGNQMYGPGCCAHKVTDSQVQKAREAAEKRGHFPPKRRKFTEE